MSAAIEQFSLHARIQLQRHLRNPVIWVLALAAPIAARYLLPQAGADYSVMAINDAYLALDPAVIGLQLGVVTAVILSPLGYIFLRAGPTRRQPWQAGDLTPARRVTQMLGHWIADTAALWLLMLALALAGVMLSAFRLPLSEVAPLQTIGALVLIAAPALAVIAGLRVMFSARRGLRGAGGDVLFFFVWLALIIMAASYFAVPDGGSPIFDILGIAAPLSGATDVQVNELVLIGSATTTEAIQIDAMAGVLAPDFLWSRMIWMAATMALVALAGYFHAPRRYKSFAIKATPARGEAEFTQTPIMPVTIGSPWFGLLTSEARLILRPLWLAALLGLVGLAGFALPLRGAVGPALALLLIFPLTAHGARWRGAQMSNLSAVTQGGGTDIAMRLLAAILIAAILLLPSTARQLVSNGPIMWTDLAAIAVGPPLLAIGLGHVTRSAVAGRLVLLILWYGYLNMSGPPI